MQKGAARPSLLCLPPYPLPPSAVIPATHRITSPSLAPSLLPFLPPSFPPSLPPYLSTSLPPYLPTSLPPYLHLLPPLPFLLPFVPPPPSVRPSVPPSVLPPSLASLRPSGRLCAAFLGSPHHAAFTPLWVRVLVWPGEVGANNGPCCGL